LFVTQPSITDIRNQYAHQQLWEAPTGEGLERAPFVGAIVGPYAQDLPADNTSEFRW
jgi:hypothetical protein